MSSIPAVIKQLNNIFNNPEVVEEFRKYLTDRCKEIKLNVASQDPKQVAKMSVLRRAKRKMDEFKKTDAL
jgi:alpha-D-ribose 1-methylphosphonate 5-triphosphate diphosphatase PhnM